jgi:hypothetical protein
MIEDTGVEETRDPRDVDHSKPSYWPLSMAGAIREACEEIAGEIAGDPPSRAPLEGESHHYHLIVRTPGGATRASIANMVCEALRFFGGSACGPLTTSPYSPITWEAWTNEKVEGRVSEIVLKFEDEDTAREDPPSAALLGELCDEDGVDGPWERRMGG